MNKKVKYLLLLAFSLAMITVNAQQIIYGKYKYMDSLTFATYKNNGSLDSVLSVDTQGRLRLKKVSAGDTTSLSNRINLKLNISDTASMLTPYFRKIDTASLSNRINLKLNISDTSSMLSVYLRKTDTTSLSNRINLKLNKSDSTAGGYYPYSSNPKGYLTSITGYVPYSSLGSNNVSANHFFDGFTSVAASGTQIVLTVNSTPSYLITGSGGQTIKMPVATTLPKGAVYYFNNNQSSGAILVNNNSNTLIKSVPSGALMVLELIDSSTATGTWDAHFQAPSNVSWSTNTFDYAGSFTNGTWNGNAVAINRGGTGATTADSARINLGAGTVTSVARTNGLGISASVANSTTTPNITIAVDTSDVSILSRQRAASTYLPLTGGTLTGTAGSGFVGYPLQSTRPSTPSTGFRFYADSLGRFSWVGSNGYTRVFDGIFNTANRTYTLPDATTTLAGLAVTQTFTGFNTFNPSVSGASSIGVSMTPTNTTTANSQIHYGLKVAQTLTNSGNFTNQSRALDVSIGTSSLIFGDFNNPNAYSNVNSEPSLFINRTSSSGWSNLYFSNTFQTGFSAGLRFNTTGELRLGTFFSGGWTNIFNNATEVARFTGGNLLLQNGGTFTDNTVDRLQINGNLNLTAAGNKIKMVSSSNTATATTYSSGTTTLISGTITVTTTSITASSNVILTLQNCSNCGTVYLNGRTAGTSFTIASTNILDGSLVYWEIRN
jgi:hypothetical protein